MFHYKVYYFKQTQSIFLEKIEKQDSTDGLIDSKTIETTQSSSVNDISIVNSEKRLLVISDNVTDPQAQYIADLKEQLRLSLHNNKILTDNLKEERAKVYSLEEELIVEKTEKEKEKEKRFKLEDQLQKEKEKKENEIKIRRKQKHEYGLLLGKNRKLEEKCQALEMDVKSNEEKSKIEVALVKKELLVVEWGKKRS